MVDVKKKIESSTFSDLFDISAANATRLTFSKLTGGTFEQVVRLFNLNTKSTRTMSITAHDSFYC